MVKIGGSVVCRGKLGNVLDDLAGLRDVVVVHGGGCLVNDLLKRMGIEPRYLTHPGGVVSRYTDEETLKVFVMGMMLINKLIVSGLLARGVEAIGLSGADMGIVVAKRKEKVLIVDERGRQRVVDGGFSGKIVRVRSELLIPTPPIRVLAPIAASDKGELLNVDGDQLTIEVARAVGAKQIILLSDVPGLLIKGSIVRELGPDEARGLASSDEVRGGMKRKLVNAAEVASQGIEVIIGSGVEPSPIKRALAGEGTRIVSR